MSANVLIFDSGVGGLSIVSEIRQLLPGLPLQYLMDSAAFPYGTKADDFLIQRILSVCTSAVRELNPDILVVACNTASTLALPALRQQLQRPVVGVVPAIKVAAGLSSSGQIGLLATPATVNRPYTDDLIREFAPHCEVRRFGSRELVQWAEDFIATGTEATGLQAHLHNWLYQPHPLSHVVLGCTHFPLLKPQLQQLFPDIGWVDSGAAIARRVATLLGNQAERLQQADSAPIGCFWTGSQPPAPGVLHYLQQLGLPGDHGQLQVIEFSYT